MIGKNVSRSVAANKRQQRWRNMHDKHWFH